MSSLCAQVGAAPRPARGLRGFPPWMEVRPALAAAAMTCSGCRVRNVCLAGAEQSDHQTPFDGLVLTRKRVHRGDHLIRAGDPFDSLYAVRLGFFKSCAVTRSGRTQITDFPMAGDLAGIDGIGSGTHVQDLVALETGEVCVVPYAQLQKRIGLSPGLHQRVNRILSREIVREQELLALLGTMDAEAKVATFLLSLAARFAVRGASSTELTLPMSRADIGSYLGLALATVSRIVSKLQRLGLIEKRGREVGIVDVHGLSAIAKGENGRWRRQPDTPFCSLPATAPRLTTLLRSGFWIDAR